MSEGGSEQAFFDSWISKAREAPLDDSDIASLAEHLAASGSRLGPRAGGADLASTGGPGSMSTIWAPAVLVTMGRSVAKLGVPGRPAGGVDVLMQIDGYRTDLGANEAEAVLDQCGYAHILAGSTFAPMDAAFFAYRQQMGAQHIAGLAIASLLSKKVATGTIDAGLEVRAAPHGNFGSGRDEAILNAQQYGRTAALLGIRGVCFITDGTAPQQPFLGRGEALLALSQLLEGAEGEWLGQHARDCEDWCCALAASTLTSRQAVSQAILDNITAQGGAVASLRERAAAVEAAHNSNVVAAGPGVVHFDLGKLRQAILAARGPDNPGTFDDTAGLILLARPGSTVSTDEPLVSVRCDTGVRRRLHSNVAQAITITQKGNRGAAAHAAGAEVIGV